MRKPAAVLIVLSLAVLALALVPAAGLAAKGGGGGAATGGKPGGGGGGKPGGGGSTGTSSISLAYPLVYDANGNGAPNWHDTVKFNVSTTATTQPYVELECFQNGVSVAAGSRGYFDDSLDTPNFGLYGGGWMSGAADCTAYVSKSTSKGMQRLASTSFHVDA